MTAGGSLPGLSFEVSVVISALFAGLVCILVTLAIERFGGVVGGVLGSIPTTIIPASFGFWIQYRYEGLPANRRDLSLTQAGLNNFQRSMMSVPPGMLLNAFYLLLWRYLPIVYSKKFPTWPLTKVLLAVFATAILLWLALASGLVFIMREYVTNTSTATSISGPVTHLIDAETRAPIAVGLGTTLATVLVGLAAGWNTPPAPRSQSRVPPLVILVRGLCAALAIAGSILLARVSSYAGGIAVAFPVIFTTSVVATWISSGAAVSAGAIGPLMLGSSSVTLYAIVSTFALPSLGYAGTTVVAFLAGVLGGSVPSFLYLRWRRGVAAAKAARGGEEEEQQQLQAADDVWGDEDEDAKKVDGASPKMRELVPLRGE
ncbi:hypothetical protein AMAG_05258 [Allomyces macrogynus ATCC 38327]|uniref:Uncharacterized protein n=1 Tax=Allomyces macrogynus (strain ATCC 38327) TaxID=578462 RepID=A0A0L0SBL0_ALLM3|nr:hypothetical protein AMAG_05258 [Allomyces macrogynus ATCC 38327]|eukprot:KNE59799.1 hypothetical protein AMAG_05258 [Allomyces macrogynus ATCC 38327]